MNLINVMTCGSVDDGKSTLLGRLIFETNNLYDDQSEYLKSLNNKFRKKEVDIDYSLLLDGLIDEKNQGITIDIAFKYFTLGNNQFTLIDSPGHKEFTKNMANAATFADAALILIDVTKGVTDQTKKHLEIISMFPNIKQKIICLNKIDKLNYLKEDIANATKDINQYLNEVDIKIDEIIPVSALNGDNLTTYSKKTRYYKGLTLLETLENLKIKKQYKSNGSSIVKFIDNSTSKRIYYVENNNIRFAVNDTLINTSTGEESIIKNMYYGFEKIKTSKNYKNLSIELKDEISVRKGDSLVSQKNNYLVSDAFKAKIVWCGNNNLVKKKTYIFRFHSKLVKGFVSKSESTIINKNSISSLQIELDEKVHIDLFDSNYALSQLLIIDNSTHEVCGFGYITQNLDKGRTIHKKILQNLNQSEYKCLWFTGLPSSGKSSIAESLGKKLDKKGIKYYILDGDNIRSGINKDLGFKNEDRIENNRRIAHIAKILFDAGVMPIVTTISPNASSRQFARSIFEQDNFRLIYIEASLKECIKRDPKNLYSDQLKKVKNITGLHTDYDIPDDYDLKIDTEKLSINESSNLLLKYLEI